MPRPERSLELAADLGGDLLGSARPDPKATAVASSSCSVETSPMSESEVDAYLANVEEPKRSTLSVLRTMLRALLPEAEECISYGMPGYRVRGKVVAGFAAFSGHLSYFPHSGSVFPVLADELVGYTTSTGALRFAVDDPLPLSLVERLVATRMEQAFPEGASRRSVPEP